MSSAATQPTDIPTQNTTANAVAQKKRRRRAPATGATEDCFSCRKLGVKCDRRRPYCGQCIDQGKQCTGYRTQLTWNVGVASRGKLRGMSLPVAKSPTQAARDAKPRKSSVAASTTSTSSQQQQQQQQQTQQQPTQQQQQQQQQRQHQLPARIETRGSIDFGIHSPTSPTSPNPFSAPEYQYFGHPTSPIPIPSPTTFSVPGYGEQVDPFHPHSSKLQRPHIHRGSLQRIHTSLAVPYEDNGLSASSASLGTYSDSDFPSPGEYPPTPVDEFPFNEASATRFANFSFNDQHSIGSLENLHYQEMSRAIPMADDVSSSISSDQSVDFNEVSSASQSMGPPAWPDIFVEGELGTSLGAMSHPGFSYLPEESHRRYQPSYENSLPAGFFRQWNMSGAGGW